MLPTYRAVLRGDRLEWQDEAPSHLDADTEISVFVTLLDHDHPNDHERGRRMADALARLAAGGGLSIEDPLAWQRAERQDRDLPGRGE